MKITRRKTGGPRRIVEVARQQSVRCIGFTFDGPKLMELQFSVVQDGYTFTVELDNTDLVRICQQTDGRMSLASEPAQDSPADDRGVSIWREGPSLVPSGG